MKITKAEFDKCWTEVFGDDSYWFIEDGESPGEYEEDDVEVDIEYTLVSLDSDAPEPEPTEFITKEDLAHDLLSFEMLYKRWKGLGASTVKAKFFNPPNLSNIFHGLDSFESTVSVEIEVPAEFADEVQSRLNKLHPKFM